MSFWCHRLDQNTNKIFSKISALASKKMLNQKKWGHFIHLIREFYFDSVTLLFWFDLFLEARAEILEKILLVFWSKRWYQKDILKLTDLYLLRESHDSTKEFYSR